MNNSIFIPKVINVGFQKRSDTFTEKLAYVIYYDAKGKLRKEVSWNSWRDESIPSIEYLNKPYAGFVLNKKAGGTNYSWNQRQTYCRIYDPRGIEFEITIENLLYILEHTNCIKGKGLEGEFVYGWSGADLILIPCTSPDYIELKELSENIHNKKKFKGKDMIAGATYKTDKNCTMIYMGRYDYYSYDGGYGNDNATKKGKRYFFYDIESKSFRFITTLSSKIVKCVCETCVGNFADIFDELEKIKEYIPVDISKDEKVYYTPEEAKELFKRSYSSCYTNNIRIYNEKVELVTYHNYFKYIEDDDMVIYCTRSKAYGLNYSVYDMQEIKVGTLDRFVTEYKPYYIQRYLENGNFYKKVVQQ